MKAEKIPTTDGIPIKFYKGFMETLEDVTKETNIRGWILITFNKTFIATISNKDMATSLEYLRPISLYNAVYKIIAKVTAKRVKGIL